MLVAAGGTFAVPARTSEGAISLAPSTEEAKTTASRTEDSGFIPGIYVRSTGPAPWITAVMKNTSNTPAKDTPIEQLIAHWRPILLDNKNETIPLVVGRYGYRKASIIAGLSRGTLWAWLRPEQAKILRGRRALRKVEVRWNLQQNAAANSTREPAIIGALRQNLETFLNRAERIGNLSTAQNRKAKSVGAHFKRIKTSLAHLAMLHIQHAERTSQGVLWSALSPEEVTLASLCLTNLQERILAHHIPHVDHCLLPTAGDAIRGVTWIFEGASPEARYAFQCLDQITFNVALRESIRALLDQKFEEEEDALLVHVSLALTGCCFLLEKIVDAHISVMDRCLTANTEKLLQDIKGGSARREFQLFAEFWELMLMRDYPELFVKTINDFYRGRRTATKVTAPSFLEILAQS
jgi:hypothetical protein